MKHKKFEFSFLVVKERKSQILAMLKFVISLGQKTALPKEDSVTVFPREFG